VFDISRTKRRCPGCIGCEQTAAKGDGRPKNASTGTGLSDVDISHDQSSRWQKFAAVSEEIFEREVQGKTHNCRRLVNSDQSELLPKADIGSAGGHVGVVQGDFTERADFLRQIRPICQLLSNSSRAMSGFAPA
jgi:hypothetical protein